MEMVAFEKSKYLDQMNKISFEELIDIVKKIPYGRNSNRHDFSLVLTENKGTCSSKHAFLKNYADENLIPEVKLIIGIYKMDEKNTPKIHPLLSKNDLAYIPEAHCYLKIKEDVIDVTTYNSFYEEIKNDLLEEIEITPNQVAEFKIQFHQNFITNWLKNFPQNKTFDEIWNIREQCIEKLSK